MASKKNATGGPLGACTCPPGAHTENEYVWGCPAATPQQQQRMFAHMNLMGRPTLDLARWVKRLCDAIDQDGDTLPTSQDARNFLDSLGYGPGDFK